MRTENDGRLTEGYFLQRKDKAQKRIKYFNGLNLLAIRLGEQQERRAQPGRQIQVFVMWLRN